MQPIGPANNEIANSILGVDGLLPGAAVAETERMIINGEAPAAGRPARGSPSRQYPG